MVPSSVSWSSLSLNRAQCLGLRSTPFTVILSLPWSRQEETGTTEDEIVEWHHWLTSYEFEQILAHGEGQGSLACCSPWGHKVQTRLSNWTKMIWTQDGFPFLSNTFSCSLPATARGLPLCPWAIVLGTFAQYLKAFASERKSMHMQVGLFWLSPWGSHWD